MARMYNSLQFWEGISKFGSIFLLGCKSLDCRRCEVGLFRFHLGFCRAGPLDAATKLFTFLGIGRSKGRKKLETTRVKVDGAVTMYWFI